MSNHLFLADDNQQFRRYVRKTAERSGWTVTECGDGYELLTALDQFSSRGIVILDIVMPGMEGVETLQNIAGIDREIPLYLISGRHPTYLELAKLFGDAHSLNIIETLSKPISAQRLRGIFSTWKNH
ncbi:MAG: response regulator [Pseudomonadota bacterium]